MFILKVLFFWKEYSFVLTCHKWVFQCQSLVFFYLYSSFVFQASCIQRVQINTIFEIYKLFSFPFCRNALHITKTPHNIICENIRFVLNYLCLTQTVNHTRYCLSFNHMLFFTVFISQYPVLQCVGKTPSPSCPLTHSHCTM